jgi:preprotein translocase subunit SecD
MGSSTEIEDAQAPSAQGLADGLYGVVGSALLREPLATIGQLALVATGKDEASNKPWIQVSLQSAEKLQSFTLAPEGQSVAIVLGERVASMHKVRTPLSGGTFQISCCDPEACERWKQVLGKQM